MSFNLLNKRDDFLYFNTDEKRVDIRPNCMGFKQVSILFNRDKQMGKKYFHKCITSCYYMNHKDSPISHQTKNIKLKNIITYEDGLLADFDFDAKYYKDFEDLFIESHYSIYEIRYLKLIRDIDDLIERLSDIPLFIKTKVEVYVEKGTMRGGNVVEINDTINAFVTIDNSKEKKESVSNIEFLDKMREMLEKKLIVEYNKIEKAEKRLFDE